MNTKDDNLLYKLETLAGYDSNDIEDDDFEYVYENETGGDSWRTGSIVDVAEQSVELIKRQDSEINELEKVLEDYGLGVDYKKSCDEVLLARGNGNNIRVAKKGDSVETISFKLSKIQYNARVYNNLDVTNHPFVSMIEPEK